jgi:hypothetical protein
MARPLLKEADLFIEQQLDGRIQKLSEEFQADAVGFSGSLYQGVDDVLRGCVEDLVARSEHRDRLVIVLTTPGGYIEVVKRMVETLRRHYLHVSFVIPNYAYSAGTVLAMSGDEIHMDYYSRLGPIDPQVQKDGQWVPALGYLVQWERLIAKARAGELTMVEAQLMIDGFDQAELYAYEQARELSVSLLIEWLVQYKFKNWKRTESRGKTVTVAMRKQRAERIARQLNDTERWHSHGHGISMDVLRRDLKLRIDNLEEHPERCEAVKGYYGLLDDYMGKKRERGVLHTRGRYVPYHWDV